MKRTLITALIIPTVLTSTTCQVNRIVYLRQPLIKVSISYLEVGQTAGRTSVLQPETSKNHVALIYHNFLSTDVTDI